MLFKIQLRFSQNCSKFWLKVLLQKFIFNRQIEFHPPEICKIPDFSCFTPVSNIPSTCTWYRYVHIFSNLLSKKKNLQLFAVLGCHQQWHYESEFWQHGEPYGPPSRNHILDSFHRGCLIHPETAFLGILAPTLLPSAFALGHGNSSTSLMHPACSLTMLKDVIPTY